MYVNTKSKWYFYRFGIFSRTLLYTFDEWSKYFAKNDDFSFQAAFTPPAGEIPPSLQSILANFQFAFLPIFNELCSKMRIDIYKYRKYVVLALTSMKFLHYLVFHEVLIY